MNPYKVGYIFYQTMKGAIKGRVMEPRIMGYVTHELVHREVITKLGAEGR